MEDKIEKELLLRDLYYSPKTGYRNPLHLWELAKEEFPKISKHFVKQWLLKQASYTRFKQWNNPKHYRHTLVRDFDQLQADLAIMSGPSKGDKKDLRTEENNGYYVILVCIEILSRNVFAKAQQSTSGKETAENFKIILEEFKERFDQYPKFIQFDEGKEFLNNNVKKLLEDMDITYFFSKSPRKASVVERVNRTLKTKMMRMFEKNKNHRWFNFLDEVVENYNHTFHRSIGMRPSEVNEENKYTVWGRLFGHIVDLKKPKFQVGDWARVLKLDLQHRRAQLEVAEPWLAKGKREDEKKLFGDFFREKYAKNDLEKVVVDQAHGVITRRPPFSREVFLVSHVLLGDPIVYKLYSEEFKREVMGIFYAEELSLVKEE